MPAHRSSRGHSEHLQRTGGPHRRAHSAGERGRRGWRCLQMPLPDSRPIGCLKLVPKPQNAVSVSPLQLRAAKPREEAPAGEGLPVGRARRMGCRCPQPLSSVIGTKAPSRDERRTGFVHRQLSHLDGRFQAPLTHMNVPHLPTTCYSSRPVFPGLQRQPGNRGGGLTRMCGSVHP